MTLTSKKPIGRGEHARVAESKAQLRKVVFEIHERIVELMSSDNSTIATSALSVGGWQVRLVRALSGGINEESFGGHRGRG